VVPLPLFFQLFTLSGLGLENCSLIMGVSFPEAPYGYAIARIGKSSF
jgi:hypothetical protein